MVARSLHGRGSERGETAAARVRELRGLAWSKAKKLVTSGKFFVDGERIVDPAHRLRGDETIEIRERAPAVRDPSREARIVHEDEQVIVIDKPSGISSVPFDKGERGTAMDLVRAAWKRMGRKASQQGLHVVHRIDKDTSGLLMFAKSKRAEIELGKQFRAHSLGRFYLCVTHGGVRPGRIESYILRDRGDGIRGTARGAARDHKGGKRAVTHVELLEELRSASFCKVRLETGKTHQIRIHLSEAGWPLVGERVYIRDMLRRGGKPVDSPRLLLHAASLAFDHPSSGERLRFDSPLPDDFNAVLERLR